MTKESEESVSKKKERRQGRIERKKEWGIWMMNGNMEESGENIKKEKERKWIK